MKKLVKKAQKGDQKAFLTLFQYYEEDIYRIAYVYVKNQNDALDIVQETACKSFCQIKTLKNPNYFKTWLVRITINSAISLLRKDRKVVHLIPEFIETISSKNKDMSLHLTLKDLIDNLNENEKSVVLLKYYYDHTFIEISNILELPIGTVKNTLYRSLEKLRKQIIKEDIYEQ